MIKRKIYRLKWKVKRGIAKKLGIAIYDPTVIWTNDIGFQSVRGLNIPGIPDDRGFLLYTIAQGVAGVVGDIAECGSRHGRSARFILHALRDQTNFTFHVFDSFEGLSEPGEKDMLDNGKTFWKAGALATPASVFEKYLAGFLDRIRIHQGWIPERFHDIADDTRFRLVHIDVDLYEPTLQSLEFFYDKVQPRGVIICDDYGSSSCPGAKRAFDEFFADRPESVFHIPTMQALVVKS